MLSFPPNPNLNDPYQRWVWDGQMWVCVGQDDCCNDLAQCQQALEDCLNTPPTGGGLLLFETTASNTPQTERTAPQTFSGPAAIQILNRGNGVTDATGPWRIRNVTRAQEMTVFYFQVSMNVGYLQNFTMNVTAGDVIRLYAEGYPAFYGNYAPTRSIITW